MPAASGYVYWYSTVRVQYKLPFVAPRKLLLECTKRSLHQPEEKDPIWQRRKRESATHSDLVFSWLPPNSLHLICFQSKLPTMKLAVASLLISGVSAFCSQSPVSSRSSVVSSLQAKKKVFIDGEAGTTGLQVRDRLGSRDDLEIISAPYELRKDEETRKKLINEADAVILCEFATSLVSLLKISFPTLADTSSFYSFLILLLIQAFPMPPLSKLLLGSNRTTTALSSLTPPQLFAWLMAGSMAFPNSARNNAKL